MRSRLLIAMSLLALLVVGGGLQTAFAGELLAQPAGGEEEESESGTTGGEEESQQSEAEDGGAGQDDPESETGAGEGEEAATETGPPWTYQMARLGIAMLVFLGLAVFLLYWRLVIGRQRGAA